MKKFALITAILVAIAFMALRETARSETFQFFGGLITHGPINTNLVALTFDDGPTQANTQTIIDILKEKEVTATFFLIGQAAEQNQPALKALIAAGHEIGNHSYSHKRMVFVTPEFVRWELDKTDAIIRAAGYTAPIPFRPPYGNKLFSLPYVLHQRNQSTLMWTFSPEADLGTNATASEIAHYTIKRANPGDIILLHPMYNYRIEIRKALPIIIDGLRAKGLEPAPLSRLLSQSQT